MIEKYYYLNITIMNIQLTKRDLNIFNFLENVWFAWSDTLHKLFWKSPKQEVFNLRLNQLKKFWYINEVWEKQRVMSKHKIYQLSNNAKILENITNNFWVFLTPSNFNISYVLITHQNLLWKLIWFFIEKFKEKNKDFEINFDFTYWSKKIQELLQKELKNPKTKYKYLEKVIIPDFLFEYNWKVYCFELENTNSYQQFESKIKSYTDLNIYKNNDDFLEIFKKKEIVLIIWTWKYKANRYKEILDENLHWIKYTIKTIDEL